MSEYNNQRNMKRRSLQVFQNNDSLSFMFVIFEGVQYQLVNADCIYNLKFVQVF